MKKHILFRCLVLAALLAGLLGPSTLNPPAARAAWLSGWANKMPVTITNSGAAALSDFQVKINLDASFPYGGARADGGDLRFTAADGISLLPYWVETWAAGGSSTFWVKVPSLPAGGGVTIYLYYGNPSATSASDGAATFYFYEGFEASPWTAWMKEVISGSPTGTFVQSMEQAKRGTHSGKFVQPDTTAGSSIFSKAGSLPGTNFVQEWDFYDDGDSTAFKMVRANNAIPGGQIGVGVWTGVSSANYAYHNSGYGYTATSVARSVGWHKLGISVTSGGTDTFFIDGAQVGSFSGLNAGNRVSVEGLPDGPTTYYVDDFRVRKYASPEPTFTLGVGGPPAVDMSVVMTDAPDPLHVNEQLTYQIAVNNYGDLDATNVTVNDTLPANVTFGSVTPSQGSCSGMSAISCSLGSVLSGGSATITVVVTTVSIGQLSNTASITCSESDSNPANNASTTTTGVGDPVVYVVSAIDTEAFNNHPTTPQHVSFDLRNFIRSSSVYIGPIMAASYRNAHLDSFGTPFKMTWYMEMDYFINNGIYADGSPMNYLTLYNTFINNYSPELRQWGDELAYHHHFSEWNGSAWTQTGHDHANDGSYEWHNYALDRLVLDAGYFPTNFRSGWLNESNQLQAWVEKWMLSDFSGPFSGHAVYDTYHPSASDYTQVGSMNHWISGCENGPNAATINAAFSRAQTTGMPVIYCWFVHDRDVMSNYLNSLQTLLTTASTSTGLSFKYATAKEALQAVMGTTDTTPPVLDVTHGSDETYNISSNEPVWNNAPYVTARYQGAYNFKDVHGLTLTPNGSNAWTVQLPAQQIWTTNTPGVLYTLAGVSATSYKPGNEPEKAIDGNETTYWDSQALPQSITVDLGSVQPVPLLTIHFYDQDTRTYTYYVDYSSDGTIWNSLVSSTTVHGTATHPFDPAVSLRYVRITVTAQSINNFAHIYEIKLYQTAPATINETANLVQVGAGAGDLAGNTSVALLNDRADLELTKIATPASVRFPNNFTYTLSVFNRGPSQATGVVLTDNLPAGLSIVSVSGTGCSYAGQTVTCNLGDLALNATATASIEVAPQAANTYVNTASVSAVEEDSNPANNTASVSTVVGNPLVYVVFAVDTEADNNHPETPEHVIFDVHNYQRLTTCPAFLTKYSDNGGASWTSYANGTVFDFTVNPAGSGDPATGFTCGSNNGYGLDDYARAVQFTVPTSGNYDVRLQLSVTGSPPDTNIYVTTDTGGNPNLSSPLSTYTAHAASIVNGEYVVIGSNLPLTAGVNYWWVASRQASGNDSNQFAVYQGTSGGGTFSQIFDPAFRTATVDSAGHAFKMSWFMEIDNFINNGFYADGRPMNYLTLYTELMNNWSAEVQAYQDEIAYHHHFMYWNGSVWVQGGHEQADTGPYDEHNNALDRMVLDAHFFPATFRAGWLNNDNQMQAWIEKWMLADVGGAGWATQWQPYHPSASNYTQVGSMNHWIANCPGGPSQAGTDAAFDQALAENRPVIYCLYMHERDDMRGVVAATQGYLTISSASRGIPYYFATSKEAMQAVIKTTDTTPPALFIYHNGGNTYTLTSNETLWGTVPYVAARYGEGTSAVYQHFTAVPAGPARTWTVTVPATSGSQALSQVGVGAIDLAGNGAVANLPVSGGPPPVPSSFFGEIHILDNPPALPATVEATVEGVAGVVGTASIAENGGMLTYLIDIPGDIGGTAEKEGGATGDLITFRINGRVMATGTWHGGTHVELNFHPPAPQPGAPSGNENTAITLDATASDFGSDAATYAWDYDGVPGVDATGPVLVHTWPDSRPAPYPVTVHIVDAQQGEGDLTYNVTVLNVAPSADFSAPATSDTESTFALAFSNPSDPSPADTAAGFTYAFDCDGDDIYEVGPQSTATTTCTPATPGALTVRGKIIDQEGGERVYSAVMTIYGHSLLVLQPGWNLVSFKLHPANTDIAQVLASVNGMFDLVYAWNAAGQSWQRYDNNPETEDNLAVLDEKTGFWIHITTPAVTLNLMGSAPASTEIPLVAGWNLVGFPAASSLALPGALSEHGVTSFSIIYSYDASNLNDPWKVFDPTAPGWVNDLTTLAPGWGYWIRLTDPTVWTVGY